MKRQHILLFLTPLLLISCHNAESARNQVRDKADHIIINGTVSYIQLEGGFYAINSTDGKKYDPRNLPQSFQKDGLKVRLQAKTLENAAGFHMYGTIIHIIEITEAAQ